VGNRGGDIAEMRKTTILF